ncbi:transposase [Paenibacillus solisilvae]|uniref:Transposase n=1 Tax=Paenibacillus solisilvae TaxID=2486751 RepID=A0ABW0W0N3_9BACL
MITEGCLDLTPNIDSIPCIATRMTEQILAEIGADVEKQFPTATRLHLCSWSGHVLGHSECAGKRKSNKNGIKYLKSALVEALIIVVSSKNYLGAIMYR